MHRCYRTTWMCPLAVSVTAACLSSLSHSDAPSGVAGAVIETPLVLLRSLSRETGCNIYAKCEFMNPTGSVKDRAAFNLIREVQLGTCDLHL